MNKHFSVVLVAVSSEFYRFEATSVSVPGEAGQLGVMSNHLPVICKLKVGLVHVICSDGSERWFGVTGGFFEMMDDHATVLADEIIDPDEAEMPAHMKGKPLYFPLEFASSVHRADLTKALLWRKLIGSGSHAKVE